MNLDRILKSFTKTVDKLDAYHDQKVDEGKDYLDKSTASFTEAERATRIADKIRTLVE
jgi:hypothetical protein